jgi:hypothetical protein
VFSPTILPFASSLPRVASPLPPVAPPLPPVRAPVLPPKPVHLPKPVFDDYYDYIENEVGYDLEVRKVFNLVFD